MCETQPLSCWIRQSRIFSEGQADKISTTPISLSVMHFLLLGATGRRGKQVVSELLSQGHTAVALVRTSASIGPCPGLTIVTGSPNSKSDILRAVLAAPSLPVSAAIITLNAVRESDSPFAAQLSPPRFLADSCATSVRFWSKSVVIAL